MGTDREKTIKGLNDIAGFIMGQLGFEQARNFIRTIDNAITLLKNQQTEDEQGMANNERTYDGYTCADFKCCDCKKNKDCYYYNRYTQLAKNDKNSKKE